MTSRVLTLRQELPQRLNGSSLVPDRLNQLTLTEIGRLPLRFEDHSEVLLGDLCIISETESDALRLAGDLSQIDGLGARLEQGCLEIDGPVGHRLGERMNGGRITVRGHAGHFVGREMRNGAIIVHGNVGDGTGSGSPGSKRGMTGGEIVVFGNAGSETGAAMRRGVIAITGDAGPRALRTAIAGTLVVFGDIGEAAGRWSKRASLIAMGNVAIPAGYAYACTYEPTFVRLLLTHLQRRCSVPVTAGQMNRRFERYCGDFAELGRGEILRAVKD